MISTVKESWELGAGSAEQTGGVAEQVTVVLLVENGGELDLLGDDIHSQAFEDGGEGAFGRVDLLFVAGEGGGAFLDFSAAEVALLGGQCAAAFGDGAAAGGDGRCEAEGELFEREEGLLVVAGAEGAVAHVFDELRGEFDVRAGDVGATSAEVLAVEPDGW
jgi:hypothetical protein